MMARAGPPLTDQERLVVGALRVLARKVAARVRDVDEQTALELVDGEIRVLIDSLGSCSPAFAAETERFMRQAIAREQSH